MLPSSRERTMSDANQPVAQAIETAFGGDMTMTITTHAQRTHAVRRGTLAAVLALAALVAVAPEAAATTSESAAYGQRVDLTLTGLRGNVIRITSDPQAMAAGAAPEPYDLDGAVASTRVSAPYEIQALLSTGAITAGAASALPLRDDAAAGATVDAVMLRLGTLLTLSAERITADVEVFPENDEDGCWSGTMSTGGAGLVHGVLGGSLVPVPTTLPASPEPNTVVLDLPGVATVTLNEQIDEDGRRSVHAVHVALEGLVLQGIGTLTGDIYLGHADAAVACGGADLAVALVESRDPGVVGAAMSYTAVVSNAGPERALDVLVSIPLSVAANPLSAAASQGTCMIDGRTLTCSLGDVRVGETASVAFAVSPVHSGAIAIPADAAAANLDVFPENNHACEITSVYGAASIKGARLKVDVADSADPIRVGQVLTYTVTVSHEFGFPVPAALASLELPFGMWLMSVEPGQGTCSGERLIVCDLGPMTAGQQVPVTVKVLVLRGGALKATGVVSSSLVDPVIADNAHDQMTQAEDPPA